MYAYLASQYQSLSASSISFYRASLIRLMYAYLASQYRLMYAYVECVQISWCFLRKLSIAQCNH